VLGGNRQGLARVRPLKRMSKGSIPRLNEALNEGAQVLGGADTGAAQALAAQEREPDLDLIEPRAMGGQPEGNRGRCREIRVMVGPDPQRHARAGVLVRESVGAGRGT